MEPIITEVAPDVFRICTYIAQADLNFAEYLVRDDEPLLFHTGHRRTFSTVCEAVARIIEPARLRWISFSHFEADECGALNQWLAAAPNAQAACSVVGARTSVADYADQPPRALADGEVLSTGKYRFKFLATPHVPHCWDAGLMFEETQRTLFCSDLLQQRGPVEPIIRSPAELLARHRESLISGQAGPLANAIPYTPRTEPTLRRLAQLEPATLAVMHGSVFIGDGAQMLHDVTELWKGVFGAAQP